MEECKLLISKYKENCRNLFLNMRRRFKDDALQDSASDLNALNTEFSFSFFHLKEKPYIDQFLPWLKLDKKSRILDDMFPEFLVTVLTVTSPLFTASSGPFVRLSTLVDSNSAASFMAECREL